MQCSKHQAGPFPRSVSCGPSHTTVHVRFAPKATVGDQTMIRRFVPKADMSASFSCAAIPSLLDRKDEVWWDGAVLGCAALRQSSDLWLIWRRRTVYIALIYKPAVGAPLDFVMSVRAKRGSSTLFGFVVNENQMIVADKNGKAPSNSRHILRAGETAFVESINY